MLLLPPCIALVAREGPLTQHIAAPSKLSILSPPPAAPLALLLSQRRSVLEKEANLRKEEIILWKGHIP